MTFRDLELPKELSKKKKLDLYKCWIVEPLQKGSEERILDLDTGVDRFGLTENAAISLALEELLHSENPNVKSELDIDLTKLLETLSSRILVVCKVTLVADAMNEDIIIPPETMTSSNIPVDFDKETLQLNATVYHRISESGIKNYHINHVEFKVSASGHIVVDKISLEEVIVNTAITGERK